MRITGNRMGDIWLHLLQKLHDEGQPVMPRDIACREIRDVQLVLNDAQNNTFWHPERGLSYRFSVAEWLWMYFGHDDVRTISQYNPHIAKFSDDGITFNGSYGVPIRAHWHRLVELLQNDPNTRQAILPIYKAPQGPTKDVPCTLTLQFMVRSDGPKDFHRLHVTANMRSSDVWLGLPYDVFNFTMLAACMGAEVGFRPGRLVLNLGSSHLYETDVPRAKKVLAHPGDLECLRSPSFTQPPPLWLDTVLQSRVLMTEPNYDVAWYNYAKVLCADTNLTALQLLRDLDAFTRTQR